MLCFKCGLSAVKCGLSAVKCGLSALKCGLSAVALKVGCGFAVAAARGRHDRGVGVDEISGGCSSGQNHFSRPAMTNSPFMSARRHDKTSPLSYG